MQNRIIVLAILITISLCRTGLHGAVLINEVSTGGQSDWVELFHNGNGGDCDISSLLVTMYRGTNEAIASSSVTLKAADDPATPFDDRYAVIHFTSENIPDETDSAGDLNSNAVRDIYCANYGLWNTDCVVALDSDDEPDNGGILDFVAFSNRDGSMNSSIEGYLIKAIEKGVWNTTASSNPQENCCDIGPDGMNEYSTLARKSGAESNSLSDFTVTSFATPGRDNVFSTGTGKKIFRISGRSRVFRFNGNSSHISLNFMILQKCSIKIKVFTSIGSKAGATGLIEDIHPGYRTVNITARELNRRLKTGLYVIHIEAVSDEGGSQKKILPVSVVVQK